MRKTKGILPTSLHLEVQPPPNKLLARLRDAIRAKHYSAQTEKSYVQWVKRFILFNNNRHSSEMGGAEINVFLTHLAVAKNAAASTQNQALSAILFLYREVLKIRLDFNLDSVRAKRPLPTVLTIEEVDQVLSQMTGIYKLIAQLLYGSGLRLNEAVSLRVKDIDFNQQQIQIRDSKGLESRVTMLPIKLVEPLQAHLHSVRLLHKQDLGQGYGEADLPFALEQKYSSSPKEWNCQYFFPSGRLSKDPSSGSIVRHHLHESGLQKALKQAVKLTGIEKQISCHTFRHSFATHLLQNGYDIHIVQKLLGHKDVQSTMIYTHLLNEGGKRVISPLDN